MTFLDATRQFSQICDLDTQGTVHVDPEAGHAEALGWGLHRVEDGEDFIDMGEFWERHNDFKHPGVRSQDPVENLDHFQYTVFMK
jgi:hypothetical protein